MEPKTVSCCQTIGHIITIGNTYEVVEWIYHKYGKDPAIVCDDGKIRVIWRGLFHD